MAERQAENAGTQFNRTTLYSRYSSEAELAHISEEPSRTQSISMPIDRNQKLLVIKTRLLELETLPQDQWTEDDIEFIKTIYQSKVNKLL